MTRGTQSHFAMTVRGADGALKHRSFRSNLTTDTAVGYTNRRDWQSKALGGGSNAFFGTSAAGFATGTTAQTLSCSTANWPIAGQGLAGQLAICGPNASGAGSLAMGVIVANTATIITVDGWISAATGLTTTTPDPACSFQLPPGQAPAYYLALTQALFAPAQSDTLLQGEIVGGGLGRALGSFTHVAGASTYTISYSWTSAQHAVINNEAVFAASNPGAGGAMPFESPEPTPPTVEVGDVFTNVVTVAI